MYANVSANVCKCMIHWGSCFCHLISKLLVPHAIMDDENDSHFMYSNAAWIIVEANGSLSALCSILIMSIIIRSSPEARSSAYHIIMFFMSFWDVIMSIAMALHTIPMPSNVHELYPFAGKALGSVGSCEAQGFLIETAWIFVLLSNTTLNLYYVCTLKYEMAEERFKKRIMPAMLVLSLAFIVLPVTALRMDFINPSPLTGVCMVSSYPFGCSTRNSDHIGNSDREEEQSTSAIECIRGDSIIFQNMVYSIVSNILIGGVFTVMLISLVLVIASVFSVELSTRRSRIIQYAPRLMGSSATRAQDFENTRAIMTQALMYIIAFLLTYVCLFILLMKIPTYTSESGPSSILSFFVVFFQPLQGFFNAIIFIYHKAYTLRRANADLGLFSASKQVIVSPSTVPQQVISDIEIAIGEIGVRRQEDNHKHRGQSSQSLREQVMTNCGLGLRRFGTNIQTTDINVAVSPNSIDSNEGGNSPLQCLSNGNNLEVVLSPGTRTASYDGLMRRYGSNAQTSDNYSASFPVSIDSDEVGNSSSQCLSSGISLRELLGPGIEDEFISMVGRREHGTVSSSEPAPLQDDEDLSYKSMDSTSLNLSVDMFSWSPDICSVIPEDEADVDEAFESDV